MTRPARALAAFAIFGSCAIPLVTELCTERKGGRPPIEWTLLAASALGVAAAAVIAVRLLQRAIPRLEMQAELQANFLDTLPDRWAGAAIFGSAAISLLLELAVIRWQGTVFEFFALYKNFGLLACFAGLGFGYALANRAAIPLFAAIPLLAAQFALLAGLRGGMQEAHLQTLMRTPFREQLNMGISVAGGAQALAIYFFLAVVFVLTALAFIPVGQLCGRLLQRRPKLRAYGLNLLGSLAGVALTFVLGWLWTPPPIWYALPFAALLPFYGRERGLLLVGAVSALAAVAVVAWPAAGWQRIYSPYQLLELGYGDRGLLVMRAAGYYYQRVHDLSPQAVGRDPVLRPVRDYYELPYRLHGRPDEVAIVGAGTGNDVAGALRAGAGRVDAVEIDPAILATGRAHHPEQPYSDRRVRAIVDDARSFLRTTQNNYDLIVYGLLDSHTLLSHASSVRLDSFVYTVEGLREARARLKDGGIVALSFALIDIAHGAKIFRMMQEAFDGRPPLTLQVGYDYGITYLHRKDGSLALPPGFEQATGFRDVTPHFAALTLRTDVSTDDWPFLYMPQRLYPASYLVMVALVLALSAWMAASFTTRVADASHLPFFFLGAGFMLVETKGITELGLTFGNTWQVTGIVIAGILLMAFIGNWIVERFCIANAVVPFLLLLASLAGGWMASGGGFAPTPAGRVAAVVLLTCPLLFSGVAFSALLAGRARVSDALAVNVFGAMFGGLLEYNSMYFGFRFLYLLAGGLYLLGFASCYASASTRAAREAPDARGVSA